MMHWTNLLAAAILVGVTVVGGYCVYWRMSVTNTKASVPETQFALERVALSLDAFLLNGIPCGVIGNAVFGGFLEKTAGTLLDDLANLDACVAAEDLRAKCQQLIDLAKDLIPFKTLPLDQVRLKVAQISLIRGECVRLLQQLRNEYGTPARNRPSSASVDSFLANLETAFVQEWHAANVTTRDG